MTKNFYFVSESVIVAFPEFEKSKPFKSGYDYDKDCNYYIAKIDDFKIIKDYYNKGKSLDNFFAYEIIDSQVSLVYDDFFDETENELSKEIIKEYKGLLLAIEETLGLTKERNVAYVLYKLCYKYNKTPIDFINSLNDQ